MEIWNKSKYLYFWMFILSMFLNFSFKFSKYDFYFLNSFRFHSIDFRILDINSVSNEIISEGYIHSLCVCDIRKVVSFTEELSLVVSFKSCPYSPRKGSPGSNRYKIKSKIGATLSEFWRLNLIMFLPRRHRM